MVAESLLFQAMSNLFQVDKFGGGDDEFIEHFEICALANGWDEEKNALMIATCLKREALEYTRRWALKKERIT